MTQLDLQTYLQLVVFTSSHASHVIPAYRASPAPGPKTGRGRPRWKDQSSIQSLPRLFLCPAQSGLDGTRLSELRSHRQSKSRDYLIYLVTNFDLD